MFQKIASGRAEFVDLNAEKGIMPYTKRNRVLPKKIQKRERREEKIRGHAGWNLVGDNKCARGNNQQSNIVGQSSL